jgi:uncharacterized protein (TIGR02646 family)
MIRINKTANIPNILSTAGIAETNALIASYNAAPNQYKSRPGIPVRQIIKMEFYNAIYGDDTVKSQLITEQHDKCCFCEGKFSDNSFGDVEHFRPKGAYKVRGANKNTYPGYFWLAYDWNNLMYSCEKCNRKHKLNNFPLNQEVTRKTDPNNPNLLANEDCLLINPIEENPGLFIEFKEEVPVSINGNLKGTTSIKYYGLERLNDSRLENLKAIKLALTFSNIDETNAAEVAQAAADLKISSADLVDSIINAKQLFNSAAKDTAKFAYSVRCKFPHLPIV